MDEDEIAGAAGAPSLADACVELGIRQKSVGDVHLIRKEASRRKATVLNPRRDPAKFRKIDWERSCALILRGPAETGKTSWAIHQFNNPADLTCIFVCGPYKT